MIEKRDVEISRPIVAKVAFVGVAGAIFAGVWLLGAMLFGPLRYLLGLPRLVWAPFSDMPWVYTLLGLFIFAVLAFGPVTAIVYRRRYAGRLWVRDVFVAMTALLVVSYVLMAVVLRMLFPSLPLGDPAKYVAAFASSAMTCLLFAAIGVASAMMWEMFRRGTP